MSRVAVMVFGVFTATGCVQPAPIARELDASAREDGGSSSDATSARDGGSLADAAPSADASPDAGAGADAVFTGWAQIINDGVQAVGSAVAADAQGNVYVAGRIDGDTDFGGGVRQTTGSFYLASYAADGRYRWDALLGFTSQFIEQNLVLTVDSGGRPVVAGTYTELGREDAFVAAYDPTSGQRVGLRQFGGSGDDELNAIAADDSGHVFVTGSVRGNVDVFGTSHSVQSNADVYVARLAIAPDASDWYRIYATTMTEAHGEAIAFRDGVVHFAGGFGGTITVGSSSFSGDFGDTFLGKVTPDGASAAAIPLSSGGGGGLLELSAMAVSAEGTRYLIGRFRGGLTVGTTSLASIRSYDVFLCAVASNDMVSWAHGYGQPSAGGLGGIDWGQALAIDAQGDLLIAGAMNGGLDLGGRTLEIAIGDGEDVMFVASISAAGMTRWAIRGGSDYDDDIAHSVAALSDGSVLVAGTISGLGGLAGVVLPFNGGLRSGFVARLAP